MNLSGKSSATAAGRSARARGPTGSKLGIIIGPAKLTRFERARIIGARALQLALGAPPFIPLTPEIRDPIGLAITELEAKALPISIRRSLPDGRHQDIPISELL